MSHFKFEVLYKSKKSQARVGIIHTPHGSIRTPAFVPVGTNASVKAVDSHALAGTNTQIIFCNTYHLLVRPGVDPIAQAGGLHKFASINCPIITDSGGFQVFSLKYGGVTSEIKSCGKKVSNNSVVKVTEDGVKFRAYTDGRIINLTPESSIKAQKGLGADLIVAFDELLPFHTDPKYLKTSFDRTHRWASRSLAEHKRNVSNQALYAVVHGGIDDQLRSISAKLLSEQDFDGMAVGGSVGKNLDQMYAMLSNLMPQMHPSRPVHLLGIGDLPAIDRTISLGIDTYDSSFATKAARHGTLFTFAGNVKLTKASSSRLGPIEQGCECYTCKNYSLGYLRHLFMAHELLVYSLASIHNLFFFNRYMRHLEAQILKDQI